MKGRTTKSGGVKALVGLAAIFALGMGTALPGTATAETQCGKVRSLRTELTVSKVSCRKAIRIVAAYERSDMVSGPKKVPGFPAWECGNGDRLGTCTKGRFAPGVPTIEFSFLEPPGQARVVPEGTGPSATAEDRAKVTGPIYFWANLTSPIRSPLHGFPNPPVIRPSSLLIFQDGSWLIEGLHWTGWGSPVAVAHGKSNSDTDKPNVAEGKRIITPAKVALYDPGVFEGRRVYRCIRMKLRPPAKFQPQCLRRSGSIVALGGPGFGTPVGGGAAEGGARHIDDFFAPGRKVWCQISRINGASCGTDPSPPTHAAFLDENGKVEICSVEKLEYPGGPGQPPLGCYQQWPDEKLPILREGEITTVAGIRCTSEPMGITCVKTSGQGKGKGFRINGDLAAEPGLAPKSTSPSSASFERKDSTSPPTSRDVRADIGSCGSLKTKDGVTYDMTIVKGSPSCSMVRRIMKRFGHPISKKPKYYCGVKGYECEYSIYPEGWRCGGFFQGHFQCWHGANDPARADEIFEGVDALEVKRPSRLEFAANPPACTKRALTKGLDRAGLPGYIDRDSFGCAGNFAYAGVIIGRDAATVLFRAHGQSWRPANRSIYCENGSVPKAIYRQGCETN
ncbi:MAG: hypothetical protein ACRDPE_10940 [Solirubrobacterales bacterium]